MPPQRLGELGDDATRDAVTMQPAATAMISDADTAAADADARSQPAAAQAMTP